MSRGQDDMSRAESGEDAEQRIQAMVGRIAALEGKHKRSALIAPSLIVSALALLFSFGTTAVSWHRTNQQDIQDARRELRSLLQRLAALPRENQELLVKYKDAPNIAGGLSAMLNQENVLLARQAVEITGRIPKYVTSTEYASLFLALNQGSGLGADYIWLMDRAVTTARSPLDVVSARRQKGAFLISMGRLAEGRAEFQRALSVYEGYPDTYVSAAQDAITELQWSQIEYAKGQCSESRRHLADADKKLSGLPEVPYTQQLKMQIAETQRDVMRRCS